MILLFCNIVFVIPLLFIGLVWGKRRFFFDLSCLLLAGMTINVALKFYFHIYLPNGVDYAFPSGHMQLATLLYAYLALPWLKDAKWIVLPLLLSLLSGIAWAMVWCGYHTAYDAAGGFITAMLMIGWFRLSLTFMPRITPFLLIFLSGAALKYSYMYYPSVPAHARIAYVGLLVVVAVHSMMKLLKLTNDHASGTGLVPGK